MNALFLLSVLCSLSTAVFGECNWGTWQFAFPLADGECSYLKGPNEAMSYQLECASNGNSATVYEYDSEDCSGTAVNESDAAMFECGNSGSCDLITISFSYYIDSDDCDGTPSSDRDGAIYLAYLTDECVEYDDAGFSWSTNSDGIYLYGYTDTNCSGSAVADFNVTGGCETSGGNSTDISFSGPSSSSSSGNGTSSDSDESGDDEDNQISTFENRKLVKFGVAIMIFIKLFF